MKPVNSFILIILVITLVYCHKGKKVLNDNTVGLNILKHGLQQSKKKPMTHGSYWEANALRAKIETKNRKLQESNFSFLESSAHKHFTINLRGDLYKTFAYSTILFDSGRDNMVCSPIAALLPLGKLVLGAKDNTKNDLLSAIGINSNEDVPKYFKGLIEMIRKLNGIHLDLVSQVFLPKNKKIKTRIKQIMEKVYDSNVEYYDPTDPSKAAAIINAWVKEKSNGINKKVVYSNDILNSDVLIVNCIHFIGKLKHRFHKVFGHFYGSYSKNERTMMSVTAQFEYGQSTPLNAEVIKIPYQKEEVALLILLPFEKKGLDSMVKKLRETPQLVNQVHMTNQTITVTLPKFVIDNHHNIQKAYEQAGVSTIFSKEFGITSLVKQERLVVTNAFQRVFFEVSIEGNIVEIPIGHGVKTRNFIADHPFLFFVTAQRQQLFAGVFTGSIFSKKISFS